MAPKEENTSPPPRSAPVRFFFQFFTHSFEKIAKLSDDMQMDLDTGRHMRVKCGGKMSRFQAQKKGHRNFPAARAESSSLSLALLLLPSFPRECQNARRTLVPKTYDCRMSSSCTGVASAAGCAGNDGGRGSSGDGSSGKGRHRSSSQAWRVALLLATSAVALFFVSCSGATYTRLRVGQFLRGAILSAVFGAAGLICCGAALTGSGPAAAATVPGVLLLSKVAAPAATASRFGVAFGVAFGGVSVASGGGGGDPLVVLASLAGAGGLLLVALVEACIWSWGGWSPPAWPESLWAAFADRGPGCGVGVAAGSGGRLPAAAPSSSPSPSSSSSPSPSSSSSSSSSPRDALGLPLAVTAGAGIAVLAASVLVSTGGILGRAGQVGEWAAFAPVMVTLVVEASAVALASASLFGRGGRRGRAAAVAALAAVGLPVLLSVESDGDGALVAGSLMDAAGAAAAIVGLGISPRASAAAPSGSSPPPPRPSPLSAGQRAAAAACLALGAVGTVAAAASLAALSGQAAPGAVSSPALATALSAAAMAYAAFVVAASGGGHTTSSFPRGLESAGGSSSGGGRRTAASRHRLAAAGLLMMAAPVAEGLALASAPRPAAASAAAAGLLMMGLGCVGASCSLAVVVDDGVGGDEEAKN